MNMYAYSDTSHQVPYFDLTHMQRKEVKLDIFAYTSGENTRPEPFRARFIPRSESIKALVEEDARTAREYLRAYYGQTGVRMDN